MRIMLIDRVDFRHLKICYDKGHYAKRALVDYSKMPMNNEKISEKDFKGLTVKILLINF